MIKETDNPRTEKKPIDPVRNDAAPQDAGAQDAGAQDSATEEGAEKSGREGATQAPSLASSPSAPYWLIVRGRGRGPHGVEVFTLDPAGSGKTLPVFGSEEAAETSVPVLVTGDEWRVRRTGGGELLSVLSASGFSAGPCTGVQRVALDPSPEMMNGSEADLALVCMGRRCFMERLMGRGRAWFDGSREGRPLS